MKRTAKVLAGNARRHLKAIREASSKLAPEFGDVDAFFETRAQNIIDLAIEIEGEVDEWLHEQRAGSAL